MTDQEGTVMSNRIPHDNSSSDNSTKNTPHVTTPEDEVDEQVIYVNPKQYNRILKRRVARAKLEARKNILEKSTSYRHHSRHKHAMKRKRGPGGRFLTKAELQALKLHDEALKRFNDIPTTQTTTSIIDLPSKVIKLNHCDTVKSERGG